MATAINAWQVVNNVVIMEWKRDKVPRDAVAQAIDYASDVASWNTERLDEICREQQSE